MVLFFALIVIGWALTSVSLTLVERILKRFFPQTGEKSLIITYLLTGGLILFFLYFFLPPLANNTFSEVYASGLEPDSEKYSDFAPQIITVSNDLLGEYKFDVRNVTDALMVGVVGKVAVAAMSHSSTIGGKAALATSTALGLGVVALGLKAMNNARANNVSSNNVSSSDLDERPPSPTNDNFSIDSPNEETTFENLMMVFQVVQVLLVTALVLFIFFVFFLWLKSKLDMVTIKDISRFWNLKEDNAEWWVNKMKGFFDRSLKFYLISFTLLILFNLSFALYFVTDLANFLSTYRF